MTKAEFLTKVQGKVGFHSVIQDELAPDNIASDPIEKRFLYVNHLNTSGTMGKTFIYYLQDKANDEVWFYNVESESVDLNEPNTQEKKLNALENYLKVTFDAYFIKLGMIDYENNWAEAIVYNKVAQDLVKEDVLVFKQGTVISHLKII